MKWYLLRSRRHLGPFSEQEFIEDYNAGKVIADDYVISEASNDEIYHRLGEVIKLPLLPKVAKAPLAASMAKVTPVVARDPQSSFPSSSFGDDGAEQGDEASRIFMESVEAADLILAKSEKTGFHNVMPSQAVTSEESGAASFRNGAWDMHRYFSARNMAIVLSSAVGLMLGSEYFKKSGLPALIKREPAVAVKPSTPALSNPAPSAPAKSIHSFKIPSFTKAAEPALTPAPEISPPPAEEPRVDEAARNDTPYVAPEPADAPNARKKKMRRPAQNGMNLDPENAQLNDEENVDREDWEEQSDEPPLGRSN